MSNPKRGTEIVDDIYHFSEFPNLDCNIYMIKNNLTDSDSEYELALVDVGNGLNSQNLIDGIKNLGLDPKKITKLIITHEHLDHILGIYNIPTILGVKPEIYAFGDTSKAIREGDEEIIAPRMLGIRPSRFGADIKKLEVQELKNGDSIEFGNFKFNIIYTPGHSQGSMSIYETTKKILFPGDVVFCGGSFGRVDFPGGSAKILKESIAKLADLDVSILCPGHMHISKSGSSEIKKSLRVINAYF